MIDSIKSIQSQQLYRVQPVSINDGSAGRKQNPFDANFFKNEGNSLSRPVVAGSPTLAKSLDLFA